MYWRGGDCLTFKLGYNHGVDLHSFGKYVVNKQIQATPQFNVYQAFDTEAQRPVIIKQFLQSATSPSGRELLARLRQSLSLNHPYIARIYNVDTLDDRPLVIMEAPEDDRTLADEFDPRRTRNTSPSSDDLTTTAHQFAIIADALDYAHSQGVVHGHLTPYQIMLTDVDEPILTDFGFFADGSTNRMSDLYALGSILYEWLTGHPPNEAASHITQSLSHLLPTIQTVILKALAKNPNQRYPTAQALAEAFQQAIESQSDDTNTTHPQTNLFAIGRYKIEAELGWRDNLIVYRAYDETLDRPVAIKLMATEGTISQAFRDKFREEIELIATLEHRCIVKVYDFGEYEGRPYVVMPYLDGGTLETRLQKDGALSLSELTPMIERIAAALSEAHSHDIVHGQLMPSNILFDERGQAYISDFAIEGMSETWTSMDNQTNAACASKYMSPEQVQALIAGESAQLNARSDIYALGIIIFEALTGEVPFLAETPYQTALAHLEEPVPSLQAINPSLPSQYQRLITRALAKNPDERYAWAKMLAVKMQELQSGRWHMSRISDIIDVSTLKPPPPARQVDQFEPDLLAEVTPLNQPFDRYQLKRELGRGGMGLVYLAYDPNIKRQVAIKVLSGHLTQAGDIQQQFQHEAKLIARLDHDYIAHVYDFGEHKNQLFIVMRYLSGGTLAQKLQQQTLKLRQIIKIVERVAEALDAAHTDSIIHNDVKPGNILFNTKGEAFLADFGIAVLQTSGTDEPLENTIGGTPKYMSPEQVQVIMKKLDRTALDGRSDIYALGVVLFEMLTGRPPFQAATPRDTALAHLTKPVPDISQIRANLPTASQQIITRALAKNPDERYQTAGALAEDFKALTSGQWLLRQLIE